MIVRMWRGQAKAAHADAYEHFVTTKVFPALPAIEGHRGAYLLKRAVGDEVEFIAVTLWDSLGRDPQVRRRRDRPRGGRARSARGAVELR